MEENANVMANENVSVTVTGPSEVLLPENNSKPGLTTGQKAIGGSVIGLAIVGIVSLIMWAVNGVKGLIAKAKEKKEAKAAAPADPAHAPATPQENAVDTQASETPETK